MDRAAVSGEAEMKTNAPWTDRTGAARNGLHTQPFLGDKRHKEIVFAHSVEYGIWLETIESGQYAIILKSMRITGYKMMNNLRYLLDRTKVLSRAAVFTALTTDPTLNLLGITESTVFP